MVENLVDRDALLAFEVEVRERSFRVSVDDLNLFSELELQQVEEVLLAELFLESDGLAFEREPAGSVLFLGHQKPRSCAGRFLLLGNFLCELDVEANFLGNSNNLLGGGPK